MGYYRVSSPTYQQVEKLAKVARASIEILGENAASIAGEDDFFNRLLFRGKKEPRSLMPESCGELCQSTAAALHDQEHQPDDYPNDL